ncbi:MAG TPA: glutathione S-transferase N-terminal domain-containing protein [Solirubrobacteraceae bacterium]|jgi:glutathione S-transferase|nr:glutathione S-transferase N-terminal domain-containing protein [Solirubrobacteraceae bacterium]
MSVKLHRCPTMFIKGPHPCWQVQKALDEADVPYEVVKGPLLRGRRTELEKKTGQKLFPAIEREDGTWVRRESGELVALVKAGEFGP